MLTVFSVLSLSGCSFVEELFGFRDTYVGAVAFGFEVSAFHPCGSDEQWWVVGDAALVDLQTRYFDLGINPYELAFAELRGDRSRQGQYGHLNAYDREFEVTKVIEIRKLNEEDCRP